MLEVLAEALEHGDLTQTGIVAAQEYVPATDFGGLAPTETYTGMPDEQVQRQSLLFRPHEPDRGGVLVARDFAVGETTAEYGFSGACGSPA
jgi:hypothetical protein